MDIWHGVSAVVLDMDGVVFIGRQLRPGIQELVTQLERTETAYHILTNASSSSRQEMAADLGSMGLHIDPSRITNSSELVAHYIRERTGARRAFTLGGGSGLSQALQEVEIEQRDLATLPMDEVNTIARDNAPTPCPLILGWTRDYNYELATKVLRLDRAISDVYATGVDRHYADDTGNLPAVAWLSGSVDALLGRTTINPAKPHPYAMEYVLHRLGRPASETIVIGDSTSDILAGNRAGCKTVLLLGGATPADALVGLTEDRAPWLVIHELTDLL